MTAEEDIRMSTAIEIGKNPPGTLKEVARQKEREKGGRYYPVGDKCHTLVFVRAGEDVEMKIAAYLERMKNRPQRWN